MPRILEVLKFSWFFLTQLPEEISFPIHVFLLPLFRFHVPHPLNHMDFHNVILSKYLHSIFFLRINKMPVPNSSVDYAAKPIFEASHFSQAASKIGIIGGSSV